MYCAVSRLPSPEHNVPSAWNTLSPLLSLANAYSLIRAELKDTASWKISPGAPPPPRPQPPATRSLHLSIHSASLTIKAENASMALGTYCVPTLPYSAIRLETFHILLSFLKAGVRSEVHAEFFPPVEQTSYAVMYHLNCIPTEGTYCTFSPLQHSEQTCSGQQMVERKEQTLNSTEHILGRLLSPPQGQTWSGTL